MTQTVRANVRVDENHAVHVVSPDLPVGATVTVEIRLAPSPAAPEDEAKTKPWKKAGYASVFDWIDSPEFRAMPRPKATNEEIIADREYGRGERPY